MRAALQSDYTAACLGATEVGRAARVVIRGVTVQSGAPFELRRDTLLERVERVQPRLVALIAPAGFGKSTLARQMIADKRAAICDVSGVHDDLDLARRLLPALASETPEQTQALTQRELMLGDGGMSAHDRVNLALENWKAPAGDTVFVFENSEHVARSIPAREFFARLLAHRPEGRQIVVCSREPLRVHLTRFAAPHEILTLRAQDLAFDRVELARLFQNGEPDPGLIPRIERVSQGWPIAVFLLKRFANEGRIEQLLERLNDVAFDELHDYLADQVLASLDPELLDALFACACIPHVTLTDLHAVLDDETAVQRLGDFAKESPFLMRAPDGSYSVHPLLASLLTEYREQARDELLDRAARAHANARRFQRAAELHLARGDQGAAAHALGQHEVIRDHAPSMGYARVLASLDRSLLHRYPRLWGVTALMRMFCIDTEELLDEAESIWRTLAPDVTPLERYYVLVFRILFMSYIGLLEEAEELLARFATENGVGEEPGSFFEGYVFYLRGLMRARSGRLTQAEHDLTLALPLVGSMDVMSSGTLLALGADIARVRGEFALSRQFVDRAIEGARRSGLYNFLAFDLAEAAFGAWLRGDDADFGRYGAELDRVVHLNGVRGFAFFAAAVRGRLEEPADSDLLKWVACGRIIMAATTPDVKIAVRHARGAVTAARQYRAPFMEALALITLATFEDLEFEAHMGEALACAGRCEAPAFVQAVDAAAQRRGDCGMLQAFVSRLQLERVERVPALEVQILSGTVSCEGRPVALSEREHALLIALALHREIVARSRLADMLWPDLDAYAGRNSLSVCMHRLRQHLGNDHTIVRSKEGYALGDEVRVDLWDLDRVAGVLRSRPALSEADRRIFEDAYEKLRVRRPERMMQWEWFVATERHIRELRMEVAHRLASDALAHGSARRAIELALEMIGYDPCDEAGRQIAITGYLAAGDRSAALRQYRQYRQTLLEELQCEPSEDIKRLVGFSTLTPVTT